MNNKTLNPLFTAITTCFLLFSSGCTQEPAASSGLEHRSIYVDNRTLETDSFILEAQKPECTDKIYNYELRVYFDVTSKEEKTSQFITKGSHLVDEKLGGEYKVQEYGESRLELGPGVTGGLVFYANIPLSIKEHNYRFSFELRGYQIDYFLYNTPDELRTGWKVDYYVSGNLVNTETVKDNKEADYYVYESSDGLSYCDTWYIDEAKTTTFNYPRVVKSDMNLYGDEAPCFGWEDIASSEYAHLSNINHVPLNKQLEIPRYHENKEIEIGYAVIKNLDIIYVLIPITVRRIESGNFQGIRDAVIYYEGSEQEWKEIYKGKGTPSNLVFLNRTDSSSK